MSFTSDKAVKILKATASRRPGVKRTGGSADGEIVCPDMDAVSSSTALGLLASADARLDHDEGP